MQQIGFVSTSRPHPHPHPRFVGDSCKIWIYYAIIIIHAATRWRFSNFTLLRDYNLIKIYNFGSICLTNGSLWIDPTDNMWGVFAWRVPTFQSLKQKCRHFDEILITGCTRSCHFDNFQRSQWWKFHQNEDISVSVLAHPTRTVYHIEYVYPVDYMYEYSVGYTYSWRGGY